MSPKYKLGAVNLSSSVNPEQLATRVKGIILAGSSIIIFLAAHLLGVQLTASDILELATQVGGVAGAIAFVYGAIQWGIAKVAEVKDR